ncbi:hypothetical protein PPERSA_12975 [Pseudocohnilembus persalinus]|uniref:Uncharacterized protein n=1 Tax=Pseudocohnilembus persalinus TaxID=266149 RepID=A0A0V0R1W4_PSEPJ|nr:hypothetical protein PPERSA_12975 [Pseudocohnilembus persalinus]|eukprot:KRX08494.1 hypothetical protein PPERSA_12975 [Pseudocohnilembus persalinus]
MSLNINLEENLIMAQNTKNFEQGPGSQNGLSAPKHHLNDRDDIFTRTEKISENQPLDKKSSNESLDSLKSQEKNYSAHSQTSKSNQEIKFEPSPTAEQDFLEKDEVQKKQNDTLFYQIGGLSIIERVVNIMYEDKVKEFQLTNISSCSQKRIQLLKKQQISFLTDLLDGPQKKKHMSEGKYEHQDKLRRNKQNALVFQAQQPVFQIPYKILDLQKQLKLRD